MAKITRKQLDQDDDTPQESTSRRPKRRLLKVAVVLALLLVTLATLAPTLVFQTPLRDHLLALALADLHGTFTVENASFGWFAPLEVQNAELHDPSGKLVASVPAVHGDKTLWALLWSPRNLGRIRIDRPQANVELRAAASNLEDIFAEYLKPTNGSSSLTIGLVLEIADATMVVRDVATGGQWQIQPLNLRLNLPETLSSALELNAAGMVAQADGALPFSCQLASQSTVSANGQPVQVGRLNLKTQGFPLELTQSLLRRVLPDTQLAGQLYSDLRCEWGLDQSGKVRRLAEGQIGVRKLLTAGAWSSGEQLRLAQIDIPCQIVWEGDQLRINQLVATSDVGQITCQAAIPGADHLLESKDWHKLLADISRGNAELAAQLDVAKLAQLLPQTLRIRDGTQITSGTVNVQLGSRPEGAGTAWQGRIEASRLVAVHDGHELAWDNPLLLSIAGHSVDGLSDDRSLLIDRVECKSDFLQAEGSGTADAFQLAGSFDLNRLAAEVSKFVDLQGISLAGQGTTNLNWNLEVDGTFKTGGQLQVRGFELATPDATPWTEEQLTLTARAEGALTGLSALVVTAAQAVLVSGGDQMTATLKAPVNNPSAGASWPVEIIAQGQLATWLKRLTPWLGPLPGLDAQGRTQWTTVATYSAEGIDVAQSELTVQPLHVYGHGLYMDEPTARVRLAGKWAAKAARLEIREAVLDTAALSAQMRDARLGLSKQSAQDTQGTITFDGDMSKLSAWFSDPTRQPNWQMTGTLKGQSTLSYNAGKTTANLETVVENLLATPRGGRQWREPEIKLVANGGYNHAADTLDVQQFGIQSDILQLKVAGQIKNMATQRILQAQGQVDYDLAKVQRILQPYAGNSVQLSGRESHPFAISGPLTLPTGAEGQTTWGQQFTGSAELGWEWMSLYGAPIGRGKLQGELQNGLARMTPLDMAFGGGKLHLAPQVQLVPSPTEFQLAAGTLADNVEITPAMCNQALMYVAPVLAGVAQAQGRFSLTVDNCRLPLSTPAAGDIAGRMRIHSAEIGTGPLMQEIATVLGSGGTVRLQNESDVNFRMVQGRVYHQGLELVFPGVTIRTQGSVGLDQTLALLVEMPIPAQWLANTPVAGTLQGQTIRVPIGGTLSHPQIDRNELNRQAAQFVRQSTEGAAESALRNGVNRGLDQLFGPMKK